MKENIICHWTPVEWWVNDFPKELEKKNTHHIILLPQEVLPYRISSKDLYTFDKILKENESKITLYSGSEIEYDFDRINFVYWPSITIFSDLFFRHKSKNSKFTSLTTIKPGREWRHYFYEKLLENNIQGKSIVFHASDLYKKERYVKCHFLNKTWKNNESIRYLPPNTDQSIIELPYMSAAIDLVCETWLDTFFVTEKTTRPIFCKKPFLVLGCENYHQKLYEEFGIEKFEIFDYSFDNENNHEKRINFLIKEIKRINDNYSYEYILEKTSDTVINNFIKLTKLSQQDYEPKKLNDIFWSHQDND